MANTTTSRDGKFTRTWLALPSMAWTCLDCGALVAESGRAAHKKWHAEQQALLDGLSKHAGFGT